MDILIPNIERKPAIGIAINGKVFAAILVNFPIAINPLPDKSPNLDMKVSINTVDLYLSFFLKVLNIVSLVGLFIPYSKTLKKIVTMPTEIIEGIRPYSMNAILNNIP